MKLRIKYWKEQTISKTNYISKWVKYFLKVILILFLYEALLVDRDFFIYNWLYNADIGADALLNSFNIQNRDFQTT